MNLETRSCANCAKKFKVLETSKQKYCSKICHTGNYQEVFNPWQDRKNLSQGEDLELESEPKKNTGKTPKNLEKRLEKDTGKIQKNKEPKTEKSILEIEKKTTSEEKSIYKKIEIKPIKDEEIIMQDTKSDSGNSLEKTESKEIQPMDSPNSLETLSKVDQPSVNLIDDSSKYLHSIMKGVFHNSPEPEIRAYDPDKVKAVVSCAEGIYKLQKLKLESIRVQKELHQYFKGQK